MTRIVINFCYEHIVSDVPRSVTQTLAAIFLACLFPLQMVGAQNKSADVIRGRVVNDSARALVATVYVTRGADRLTQQVSTDSAGYFHVRFEEGTGDYLVYVGAPGFKSARRRVQRQGSETEFVVNFDLVRDVSELAAVRISSRAPIRVTNSVDKSTEIGASEQWKQGVKGQLPPRMSGNLDATAGTMSNVTLGPLGPSILGSGPESNLKTLNGMGFSSARIPRAARTETRVSATTFDPSRGGFAGANFDVRLGPGNRMYQQRNAFVTLDPRQWQFANATGRALGGPSGGFTASIGADGELIRQALTYNVAVDITRSVSTPATLLSVSPNALRNLGVAPDSAARVLALAPGLGLLPSGGGIPVVSRQEALTWLGRLDDIRDTLQTRALTSYMGFTRSGAVAFDPLSAPSTAGEQHERTLGAQVTLGRYIGPHGRVLTETRIAASQVQTKFTPYRKQPSAIVLIPSFTEGGRVDIGAVTLGGGVFLPADGTRWTVEGANETVWNTWQRNHRFKTLIWGRFDGLREEGGANDLGTFTFNSVEDFGANRPMSFFRTLSQPTLAGTVWNAAASFTHTYVPSRFFRLLYGARLEANGVTRAPARNTSLEEVLGVRTGVATRSIHVSPRAGFSYTYVRDNKSYSVESENQFGRFSNGATGVISGGIGEFRDLLRPDIRASAGAATGLPGATTIMSCVGSSVPAVDWANFTTTPSTIPVQCLDGSSQLVERAPAVTLIAPAYDVPRSWRASLNWSTNIRTWLVNVGSMVSYDLARPGVVDANFSGVPRLTLANEAGRPVYVSSAGIDAVSGAVSATEARKSDQFGSTSVRVSDLRGYGGQFTFSVTPSNYTSRIFASANYTLQWVRRQYRGFDGAAFGDPRLREWAPGSNDARHVLVLSGGFIGPWLGTVTLFARTQSGLPFTPIVQGDVNGDGRSGDRAFVPDPASETDGILSSQIQSLLANGTSGARRCLGVYLGRAAARNGCRGPWTQSLNIQWSPILPRAWGSRVQPNIYLQNALAGLDQILHGDASLRGWGGQSTPDAVLLVQRGFDPDARRFRYDVNPRFGDTRGGRTLGLNPFRIMIDFSINLSTNIDIQQLRRATEPVRGTTGWQRRSPQSLTAFYLSTTSSIHKSLLAESDSLFLSAAQIAALQRADSIFSERVRTLYLPLGEFLARREGASGKPELDSARATSDRYWRIFWEQVDIAAAIVTPAQREFSSFFKFFVAIPVRERENTKGSFGYPVTLTD